MKRFHFWISLGIVLTLALSLLPASIALAAKPAKYEFSFNSPGVLEGVCSFTVYVDSAVTATGIDFYDESGLLIKTSYLFNEQDTFTANGKTLVGIPFSFHLEWIFDGSGNPVHIYSDGVMEKIWLPDGSLFVSAGRVDFTKHPGAAYLLSPDKGNPGNVAGFCAALAP